MEKGTVGIHQPNYLPWAGYFAKMRRCEKFIILDVAQYSKNNVINRNKIRTKDGWAYITIPIEHKHAMERICDIPLPIDNTWAKRHLKTIDACYSRAPYYNSFKEDLMRIYSNITSHKLVDFNMELITFMAREFGCDTQIMKCSELGISESKGTERIAQILSVTGAKKYITGQGASNYLDTGLLRHIPIEHVNYASTEYKQAFSGFEPNMSALDLLLNQGENAWKLL